VSYMSVSPDQLSSAGAFVARGWDDYGYAFEGIESPTRLVSVFRVVCTVDGSRFAIAVDRWSNCALLPDDADARVAKIRAMHEHARTP